MGNQSCYRLFLGQATWSRRLGTAVLVAGFLAAVAAEGGGQAAGVRHPVLKHEFDPARAAEYEKAVERVMSLPEEAMLAFVPDRPFCRFCYCPNCHAGYPADSFTWSIDRPDEIKCSRCGMVYPNDKFPDDQVMSGSNALGEAYSYRFQVDTTTGIRIFLPAHLLMFRRHWVMRQAYSLGLAYQATKKPEYARRAALIFDRVAQVYPHYPVMEQWITTFYFAKSQKPPYPLAGGRWGRWAEDELPGGVPEAYDLVYDSDEFDKLSLQRGYDVRERFEKDFLKATFEYTDTFGAEINAGNMAPISLMTAVRMGRVISEPHYVHWAYRWLKEILHGGCFHDGMWHEGPSYHYQTLVRVGWAFDELAGYSDPPGYVDKQDGQHFQDLHPKRDNPFIARALNAPAALDFPNGCSSPIDDTWPNERRSTPRQKTVSSIRPGYGHASLGLGEGVNQMQAQLNFSGAYGHSHLDNLNLTLFAKERELLCDLGYTHTQARHWNSSTTAHNLVSVDRRQQGSGDGDLLAYFPNTNGVAMVEADGRRAYAAIKDLDVYRRLLVTVPVSSTDAYVFDVFRVRGGVMHDWLLHGNGDEDMTAECSVELPGRLENLLETGEAWVEPRDEQSSYSAWGVIRDIRAGATVADGVATTFRFAAPSQRGVRVHLFCPGQKQVYLGRSPAPRRAGSDIRKAFDYWMPQLVVRRTRPGGERQGDALPLASVFAAVEEPFVGKPFIDAIASVAMEPSSDSVAALRIRYGNTVDTMISTADALPYPDRRTADGIRIKGRLGLVRQTGDQVTGLWLFDGEELACGEARIRCDGEQPRGSIETIIRKADGNAHDGFLTTAELPLGEALHGQWLIVTHGNGSMHGYEINRVEARGNKRLIVLTFDHGLKMDGTTTQEVYFPRRTIEGVNRFVVPLSAALAPEVR